MSQLGSDYVGDIIVPSFQPPTMSYLLQLKPAKGGSPAASLSQDGVQSGLPALGGLCLEAFRISCSRRRFLSTWADRDKALAAVPRVSKPPALQTVSGWSVLGIKSSLEVRAVLSRSPFVTMPSARGYGLLFFRLLKWMVLQGPGPCDWPTETWLSGLSCKEPDFRTGSSSGSAGIHTASGDHGLCSFQLSGVEGLDPLFLAGFFSLTCLARCPSLGFRAWGTNRASGRLQTAPGLSWWHLDFVGYGHS